jgi:hypothetical protein
LEILEPPASQCDSVFFVQRLIIANFHEGRQTGSHKWNEIICFMSAFIAAIGPAATVLTRHLKGGGFVEVHVWRELIRELTRFCKERSLPVGASKGFNKSRTGEPSRFVAFVHELQRTFPNRFRRHNFSHEALAKAIATARRPPSRDRKPGEAKS